MANINEDKTIPKNQSNNEIKKEILEQKKRKAFAEFIKMNLNGVLDFFVKFQI